MTDYALMTTRAAALLGLALSWPAHATVLPTVIEWSTDDASLAIHAECLDGSLYVLRELDNEGHTRTQMGYSLGDYCDNGRTIATGHGLIPNDALTGTGKTTLHLIANTSVTPDMITEGEPVVIDVTWAPADEGDFTVYTTRGRSVHGKVVARFNGETSSRAANVTGTVNLFVPTDADIGWSRNRSTERTIVK